MREKIILVLKGFILGIANIIPGVSGGTLAITLGIYEELISVISHFFSNLKKNLTFIIPIGIGAVASILLMSKLINYTLENYPIPTTLFFIGLIVGGIPLIYKRIKNTKKEGKYIVSFLIPFIIILPMSFTSVENVVDLGNLSPVMIFILFLVGIIAAATMVIPGISGSFILMLLGFYKPVLKTISSITKLDLLGHNIEVLLPFVIGIVVGIVVVAKLIEYLLAKHEKITYYMILGFIIASVISLIISLFAYRVNILNIIVGIILFIIGSAIGYKLGDEGK